MQQRSRLGHGREAARETDSARALRLNAVLVLVAVLICATLAFHGLTNHVFWDDEANTGIFARNLLRFGELTAWDGQNLIGFRLGAELDEQLLNAYMPRMQYYVAAFGFLLFGETTFGARVLFVVSGLASLPLVAIWTRHLLGARFPAFLPAMLLATSPAFLLYIRNARYYSLGILFTSLLFVATSANPTSRRSKILCVIAAVGAAAALIQTHYIYAAYALVGIALHFVLRRYRTRHHTVLIGSAYATAAVLGVRILLTASPFSANVALPGTASPIIRFTTLLTWHLRDLAQFEFVPVLALPALVLPLWVGKEKSLRPAAGVGLWLLGLILVATVLTAAISPQPVDSSDFYVGVADMRYLVPLMVMGAIATSISLRVLWAVSRPLAVAVTLSIVFTNIPHLAFTVGQDGGLPSRTVSCTLCEYVRENANDYETATEMLIRQLEELPGNTLVLIQPGHMAYSPMFYLPDVLHCCQLTREKSVARGLPAYVYAESANPEVGIVLVSREQYRLGEPVPLDLAARLEDGVELIGTTFLDGPYDERSRPEIPWHSFNAAEFEGSLVPDLGWVLARPR